MGEIVRLKRAVATTAVMQNVVEYAATGALTVVFGRIEKPEHPHEWNIVIRAPDAPDMVIASGEWPEGHPDDEWARQIGVHIEMAKAVLAIAHKRLPALTADGAPNDSNFGAA